MSADGLSDAALRRVLEITSFEYCSGSLFWRKEGDDPHLLMFADCSDFFAWGCTDVEPIETDADVDLLATCLADLRRVSNDQFPLWLGDLYAARRRHTSPAGFMFTGKWAMDACYHELFSGGSGDTE